MFNRRGSSSDDLGMPEPINELEDGRPLRTHNKYYVKFTNNREEAFKTIHKQQIHITNPL